MAVSPPNVLVLNAGSSSLKTSLYTPAGVLLWGAEASWSKAPELTVNRGEPEPLAEPGLARLIPALLGKLQDYPFGMVAHRIVHGGTQRASTRITGKVQQAIEDAIPLAPNHNPASLISIQTIEQCLGEIPQFMVLDTAFHRHMLLAQVVYPGPYAWYEQGLQRFGFHGISHQYAAQQASAILGRDLGDLRLITAHLGNGCSLAAVREGHSVATTMGFTPLEGLMMGTRSGSVDPGLLLHVLRQGLSVDALEEILATQSGLKGISGLSGDLRDILAACAQGHVRAQLAYDIYIQRIQAELAGLVPSLGRLDGVIFTGGVGENSAEVRQSVCDGLGFLGLALDPMRNQRHAQDIATDDAAVRVLVIPAQENWAIAQEALRLFNEVTDHA